MVGGAGLSINLEVSYSDDKAGTNWEMADKGPQFWEDIDLYRTFSVKIPSVPAKRLWHHPHHNTWSFSLPDDLLSVF